MAVIVRPDPNAQGNGVHLLKWAPFSLIQTYLTAINECSTLSRRGFNVPLTGYPSKSVVRIGRLIGHDTSILITA